jgi:hypothetical protein
MHTISSPRVNHNLAGYLLATPLFVSNRQRAFRRGHNGCQKCDLKSITLLRSLDIRLGQVACRPHPDMPPTSREPNRQTLHRC